MIIYILYIILIQITHFFKISNFHPKFPLPKDYSQFYIVTTNNRVVKSCVAVACSKTNRDRVSVFTFPWILNWGRSGITKLEDLGRNGSPQSILNYVASTLKKKLLWAMLKVNRDAWFGED